VAKPSGDHIPLGGFVSTFLVWPMWVVAFAMIGVINAATSCIPADAQGSAALRRKGLLWRPADAEATEGDCTTRRRMCSAMCGRINSRDRCSRLRPADRAAS
jgi:hypothetical protein